MSDDKPQDLPSSATQQEALNTLQKHSVELLQTSFTLFLNSLINHLFDLSSQAQQITSGYNAFYEAMNAVKRNKSLICKALIDELSEFYDNPVIAFKGDDNHESNSEKGSPKLGLIGIEEFEGHLTLDKIINIGTERYCIPMESLTIRLAQLIEADPNSVRLPIHVEQISRAFPRSIKGKEIPKQAIPNILNFFQKEFIEKLGTYYETLNLGLREAGIRPNLEKEIETKGSFLHRGGSVLRPVIDTVTSPPPEEDDDTGFLGKPIDLDSNTESHGDMQRCPPRTEEKADSESNMPPAKATVNGSPQADNPATDPAGSALSSPDSLYNSVITALNFKREADALLSTTDSASNNMTHSVPGSQALPGATTVAAAQQNLADSPSIADALNTLQKSSIARSAIQKSASLREYLSANYSEISELKDTQGLSPESINQLDLVDNLFGTIQSQLDVTSELKPALGNLQIPLAKLALLEPRFFVDGEHPARGVVDKLAQLAASANFPNKALEARIERIVDTIVADYDSDSIVFEDALSTVDKLVTQQQRAQERNVERVVKTHEGEERLRKARQAVTEVISARITFPSAPEVLIQLIDAGWRDLLVFTHVREGPLSDTWREHVRTLDLLSIWLTEQREDSADEDMLMRRSLEAEPLIDMISQQISNALPTHIAHEAVLDTLRDIFAGQQDIKMVPVPPPTEPEQLDSSQIREKVESLPRIRRWIQRVNQLTVGTWLNYTDPQGQKRRMQLAWISKDKDRFIFVNERGQRHADMSSVQLARLLSRGVKPPTPADNLSLIDQSMYDTLEHVQKSLSFARNHDSLTKLINYDTFLLQVGSALKHSQRKHSQHAVLYLDIDHFTLVNEVYDEVNSDLVLLEFAKLLAQLHGKKSSSSRILNDEFAILLLDRNIEQAIAHAEQIRADIEASSIEIDDEKVTFTVSIGVAPIHDYSPAVEDLIECAKSAMHLAKERGRNQVAEFKENQSNIDGYRASQQASKLEVQTTLETDRFVLRAQPIVKTSVDGSTKESQHYELLLGLTNKDGSLSSPQEFILSAERHGYMGLVDRWVVKEAFGWISQLMDSQKIVPNLSINLSGSSIIEDSFMDFLLEQISEFGVGTNKLCFEITETGTISNLVKAADFVRAFRNIGCKFSIDDFGTGLASHNYLRELPVDYVKIDGTFITEINNNRNDYAMTRSINDLAHFLGQKTIAESVENEAIIEKLMEIGVDYLQGWGIGKPRLLSEITAELATIEK